MFVILTAYGGSLQNDRYMNGWILKLFTRQILEILTDRQTEVC